MGDTSSSPDITLVHLELLISTNSYTQTDLGSDLKRNFTNFDKAKGKADQLEELILEITLPPTNMYAGESL